MNTGMTTKDWIEAAYWIISLAILIVTVYYIATGPVNAVRIGRKLNIEQQKDNAKRTLFLTLFAYRGSPAHHDFVRGLNQIDIVFHDTPTVLKAWHDYYNSLQIKTQVNEEKIWELLRVELLSQMAISLEYHAIKQVDMAKHYYPEGHEFQYKSDFDLKQAALNYFQIGRVVYEVMLDNTPSYKEKEGQEKNEQQKD